MNGKNDIRPNNTEYFLIMEVVSIDFNLNFAMVNLIITPLGNIVNQIDNTASIAPFVVIPTQDFY